MIKKVMSLCVIALFSKLEIKAQEPSKASQNEFVINVGPTFSNLKNASIDTDEWAIKKGHAGFFAGVGYGRFFGSYFGLGLGVNYNQIKNTVFYRGAGRSDVAVVIPFSTVFYPYVESNYYERRTAHLLDFPLSIKLQLPINNSLCFFIDAGMIFHVTLYDKLEKKGTLKYAGAFLDPQPGVYHLYEEAPPEFGFGTTNYSSKQSWNINPINFSFCVNGGLKYKLNEKTNFIIAPMYLLGLNDITSRGSKPEYANVFREKSAYQATKLSQLALRLSVGFSF